jgi:hypothetical protein
MKKLKKLKITLVKIANYGTSVCEKFGGNVAAYSSRSLLVCACVCMLHCLEVEKININPLLYYIDARIEKE